MGRGKLVVMEGLDGSGKATQAKLLLERISPIAARKISFPDYNNKSSVLAKMYLDGEVGTIDEVNAYAASSFYSVDRYISYEKQWKTDYLSGTLIIADRYTTSNACHQMVKLPVTEWDSFLEWLQDYEYCKLGIPTPNLVIYLDMHPNTSKTLLAKRYGNDESKKDIHEANFAYLIACRTAALYAAKKLNWCIVPSCDGEQPKPVEEIAEKVLEAVKKFLEL